MRYKLTQNLILWLTKLILLFYSYENIFLLLYCFTNNYGLLR